MNLEEADRHLMSLRNTQVIIAEAITQLEGERENQLGPDKPTKGEQDEEAVELPVPSDGTTVPIEPLPAA